MATLATLSLIALPACAIEQPGHVHPSHATGPSPAGSAGDPADVTRSAEIRMDDRMRYSPATLLVDAGETVRLTVRNDGKALHELVIGTTRDIAEHRKAMRRDPATVHGSAAMLHVRPGQSGTLIWKFGAPGVVAYACLLPGHYEAGMQGTVLVR